MEQFQCKPSQDENRGSENIVAKPAVCLFFEEKLQ